MPLSLIKPSPEPDDVDAQLGRLGTRLEVLHDVLRAGEMARGTAVLNDPMGTAGRRAYEAHVRTIRERHIKEGWARLVHGRLELVCNADRSVAMGVMVGNSATGQASLFPKNARRRGSATDMVTRANVGEGAPYPQTALFVADAGPTGSVALSEEEARALKTWFLLSYRRETDDAVRVDCELSQPKRFEDGFVVEWGPRIPLPPLTVDGVEHSNDDGPGEIDIPVPFR